MYQNELYYKKVISSIGIAMMVFWVMMQAFGFAIVGVEAVLFFLPIGEILSETFYQLFYAVGYLLIFMLPAVLLRRILRFRHCPQPPMRFGARFSPYTPFIIFAGIMICFSAAEVNAALVSVFDYSAFSSEFLWGTVEEQAPYETVLNFIVLSLVPGFCEEFLFRGAILGACRPFGRVKAILISALLFALMHQNAEQLLYTFVMGIFLGIVYEHTGSIWTCTLLHVVNNFISVIETVVYYKLGETMECSILILLIEGTVYFLGILSIFVLMRRARRKMPEGGVFEKVLPPTDDFAVCPVEGKRAVLLFLRPSMVAFILMCLSQILLLLAMAIIFSLAGDLFL